MENFISGKEKNKKFIDQIKEWREKLFLEARPYDDNNDLAENVEQIDSDKYIMKEDINKFNLLNTLLSYLDFKSEPAENTYEIYGFAYKNEQGTQKTKMYISKENALKLSRSASRYELEEMRKQYGIIFPLEILELKYKDSNMPGLTYGAPEPKTAAQTIEDYENYLEQYYGNHGLDKVPSQTTDFREAYPHEKVNYRTNPPSMSNNPLSSYYDIAPGELLARAIGATNPDQNDVPEQPQNQPQNQTPPQNGGSQPAQGQAQQPQNQGQPTAQPGQPHQITGTNPGLGRKIGQGLLNLKNIFKSPTLPKKLHKALVVASVGAVAISCLAANPLVAVALAGGIGTVALTGKALAKPIKKGFNAFKKKVKEWLFGKPIVNNTPQNGGNQPAQPSQPQQPTPQNGGSQPVPQPQPTPQTPPQQQPSIPLPPQNNGQQPSGEQPEHSEPAQELQELKNQLMIRAKKIETIGQRIETLLTEINNGVEPIDEKQAELKALQDEKKLLEIELVELLHNFDQSHNNDNNHATGGPRR